MRIRLDLLNFPLDHFSVGMQPDQSECSEEKQAVAIDGAELRQKGGTTAACKNMSCLLNILHLMLDHSLMVRPVRCRGENQVQFYQFKWLLILKCRFLPESGGPR